MAHYCPVCSGSSEQKAKPSKWQDFDLGDEDRLYIQKLMKQREVLKSIKEQMEQAYLHGRWSIEAAVTATLDSIDATIRVNTTAEERIKDMPKQRMIWWLFEKDKLPHEYSFPLTSYQRQMNRIRAAILNYESANEQDKAEAREWAKMDSELIDVLNNWPCSNPC